MPNAAWPLINQGERRAQKANFSTLQMNKMNANVKSCFSAFACTPCEHRNTYNKLKIVNIYGFFLCMCLPYNHIHTRKRIHTHLQKTENQS